MNIETARPNPEKAVSSPAQKFQLGVVFALYLLVGLNSGGFGVILPTFSDTYGLSKSDTGLLFVALTAGYLIAAVTGSWLSNLFGLRNFIIAGLLLTIAGSLTLWVLPPFWLALMARLVLGLAGAVLETGGNFYVAFLPRNTSLLNYLHAFFGAGALLGPLVATWVLENNWGWNSLYLIWLICALVVGLAFRLAFGNLAINPLSSTTDKPAANEKTPSRSPMLTAITHPAIIISTVFLLVYVGGETSVGSWSFTYLTEGQQHSAALSGGLVSIYWLGLTLGRLALGWLVERPGLVGRDGLVLLGCIVVSMAGAGLVWLAGTQPIISGLGLLLIGFSYGPIYPTTLAVLSRMVDPDLVSSAIGLITGLSILGVAIFPWIAGNMLQMWGLIVLFPYVLGLGAVMVVLCLAFISPRRSEIGN